MTKADIIEFLQPFADDTPIVVRVDPIESEYRVVYMAEYKCTPHGDGMAVLELGHQVTKLIEVNK